MPLHRNPASRPRRRMLCALGLLSAAACQSLSYPEAPTSAPEAADAALVETAVPPAELGVSDAELASLVGGIEAPSQTGETGRSWYALSRSAREARRAGRYDEAGRLLEQAAMQLSARAGDNAQRRAVHGMRARLALDLLALDRPEDAEPLADALLAEAEVDPAVGGPATIELASAIADRRAAEARRDGLETSALPLMRIALQSAASEPPSRTRLELANNVAREAERQGDPALARAAVDRALGDARILEPTKRDQLASLEIFRARIAIAQDDLAAAERSAAAANRLLDEIDAPAASRAIGEATMARVVAESGDAERARAIARTAEARLEEGQAIGAASRRVVLGELARTARALGETEIARDRYRAALDLPGSATARDTELVSQLAAELKALDETPEAGAGVEPGDAARAEAEAESLPDAPTP